MKDAAPPRVLIMTGGARGRGSSALSQALRPIFFKPMIRHVLDAAASVPRLSLGVVVGQGEPELREQLRDYADLGFFPVREGTGEAVALLAAAGQLGSEDGSVLVLDGRAPLLGGRTLVELWERHARGGAACTSAMAGDAPAGAYAFALPALLGARAAAEGTLEDVAAAIKASGLKTSVYRAPDDGEAIVIENLHDLWRAETVLRERFNRELMRKGVWLSDPRTTVIDPRCRIDQDVSIEGGVTILNSIIESGVKIESACRITDSTIGRGGLVKQGTRVDSSRAGQGCVLGPYAHLRPGTTLADEVFLGNFVEVKNSSIGARTKVSHLSYIGDAEIGRNVNVGCGFITCNFDGGPVKQRTIVEDDVFIGSDSQAIAPVRFGAGSFIATGTSVTDDVPPDSFAISRGRQVTKPGYAKKYGRKKTPTS